MDRHNHQDILLSVNNCRTASVELCKKLSSTCVHLFCASIFDFTEVSLCLCWLPWTLERWCFSTFFSVFEYSYSETEFGYYVVNKLSCNKNNLLAFILCFVRIGPKEDFFHCLKCNLCLAMNLRGKHKVYNSAV